MGKVRVYELAKELGVENKVLIARAQELGFDSIKSHSNSLDASEADQIRRDVIRQAIGAAPDSEVVRRRVNRETGETDTIVEKRKGNVIRRRRREGAAAEEEQAFAEEEPEPQTPEILEIKEEESQDVLPEVIPDSEEPEAEETPTTDVEPDPREESAVSTETTSEEPKKGKGPKVLGKIDLPEPRQPRSERGGTRTGEAVRYVEDLGAEDRENDRKGGKRKKKGRKREISRRELVDYEAKGPRKSRKQSRSQKEDSIEEENIQPEITTPKASKRIVKMEEFITVGDLANQMSLKSSVIISKLIEYGVMATINQPIDQDTATIIAEEFEYKIESVTFDESDLLNEGEDVAESLIIRPPVVTVMGHVDHGKTSLLDYIRESTVAAKEHGGITQHIGAYNIELPEKGKITFIDTPGHEAFTSMRARGAQVTDIVILVVAADDGVMPQTVEALNHAQAAGVSIVVAINKMDRPGANPDKIRQQLAERGLQPEDWGGDTMFFPCSAHTGDGIQELLEGLLLIAELKELKANPDRRARGIVVEARQERGRGVVATVLVETGTMRIGDIYVTGAEYGRVRSMLDHLGERVEEAGPSIPVEITGLNGIPQAGDDFVVVESESVARQVATKRTERVALEQRAKAAGGPISLEEFARRAQEEEAAELNVVLKADVDGSLGAVEESLRKLETEKVRVKVIHSAVGGVNESDVKLALASNGIILAFGVRAEPRAMEEAEGSGVDVRFYRVIYELIDDVKSAMEGLLAPIQKEVELGRVEVRDTFSIPKIGIIAGAYVQNGVVKRGALLRLVRDSRVVHEGKMLNLKRQKDDVKEVQSGYECGISFDGYNDIKVGDIIEVYEIQEEAAKL